MLQPLHRLGSIRILEVNSFGKYSMKFFEGWDKEEAELDFKELYKRH